MNVKCNYCGDDCVVYHASKGIHACNRPDCERKFEADTQFSGKEVMKETFPAFEQELPFVAP